MTNLSFQYPAWFLIFCVLLGLAYALVLYYKDQTFRELSTRNSWILGSLRFLAVTIIAILLMSPVLKSLITEVKKPVVLLAQDESESIANGMRAADTLAYHKAFDALANSLGDQYDVKKYAFGEKVREGIDFQYKDKISNISDLLKSAYDLYSNQNLGAIVIATDGIYNEGSNPLYASAKLAAPVYTIALGDTTPRKDVILKRAFHNDIAYLGDKFSVQIDVVARNCAGSLSTLTVGKMEGNNIKPLQQYQLSINSNDFFTTREIILDASSPGVQRYRINVTAVKGEVTTVNNVKDIFIDVLDGRDKILILANSPHPDVSAFNQVLSKNKNYQVTVANANDLKINPAAYDFVILHQLPSKTNGAEAIFKTLNDKKTPRLIVVGSQTDLRRINAAQQAVIFNGDGRNTNEVQGVVNSNFNLFTLDPKVGGELPNFTPLTAPFGDFKDGGGTQSLLFQRIGKIDTRYPLLSFQEQNGIKTGVLCGENIWRWRLFDFLQHQNHDLTDELISKSVQYLSVKEDKRKFRATIEKNVFKENESVPFGAELYNDSYQLINDPDVSMVISSGEGKEFRYTFNKTDKAYALDAGVLPVGNYTFKATTNYNSQTLTYNGQFSVQPIQLELYESTADHTLLRQLSQKFGGEMVYAKDMATIGERIKATEKIKPVQYQTSKTRSVIHLKWIFFLILGLLSLEWFLRRYWGAY